MTINNLGAWALTVNKVAKRLEELDKQLTEYEAITQEESVQGREDQRVIQAEFVRLVASGSYNGPWNRIRADITTVLEAHRLNPGQEIVRVVDRIEELRDQQLHMDPQALISTLFLCRRHILNPDAEHDDRIHQARELRKALGE